MAEIQYKQLSPKIYSLKGWIELIDEGKLNLIFKNILQEAGFNILNFHSHQFPVNGYTAFWLLAESHLALHSFAENSVTYIELSSCNPEKTKNFQELSNALDYQIFWDCEIECSEPVGY